MGAIFSGFRGDSCEEHCGVCRWHDLYGARRDDLKRCYLLSASCLRSRMLAMIKEREQVKQQLLKSSKDLFCHRFRMKDWSCNVYNSVMEQLYRPPSIVPPHPAQTQPAMMQHMYNQQIMQAGQQQVKVCVFCTCYSDETNIYYCLGLSAVMWLIMVIIFSSSQLPTLTVPLFKLTLCPYISRIGCTDMHSVPCNTLHPQFRLGGWSSSLLSFGYFICGLVI